MSVTILSWQQGYGNRREEMRTEKSLSLEYMLDELPFEMKATVH